MCKLAKPVTLAEQRAQRVIEERRAAVATGVSASEYKRNEGLVAFFEGMG